MRLSLLRTNPLVRYNPMGFEVVQDGEVYNVVDADGKVVTSWSSKRLADAYVAKKTGQAMQMATTAPRAMKVAVASTRKASSMRAAPNSEEMLVAATLRALPHVVKAIAQDDPGAVAWVGRRNALREITESDYPASDALLAALAFDRAGARLSQSGYYYFLTGDGTGPEVDITDEDRHIAESFWTPARLAKYGNELVYTMNQALPASARNFNMDDDWAVNDEGDYEDYEDYVTGGMGRGPDPAFKRNSRSRR